MTKPIAAFSCTPIVVYWTPLFIIVIDDHVHVHVYLDSVCCEYIIVATRTGFVVQKVERMAEYAHATDYFDPKVERVEEYKERFDFYCTAHAIEAGRQKALFLTRIG